MKRIMFVMLMLASVAAFAQKPSKPNINKALNLMKEGKLSEAKDMIDAATTYEKTMNDGKTWYYRGLIYAAIDTTSNETYKALDPDPLKVAMESFKKADQLGKKDSEYFTTEANNPLPVTKSQQLEMLANYYLDKGIKQFQDESDYEASLKSLDKTRSVFEGGMNKYANDTLTYYVIALVGQQAEKYDLAIENTNKYLEKGGKSKDAYLILYQIYNGPKDDKKKALEVIQKARAAHPTNPDFPKVEIGLLIDMGKVAEAKAGLEDQIKKEPDNKILHFYLGYINLNLADTEKKKVDSVRNSVSKLDAKTQTKLDEMWTKVTPHLEAARKNLTEAIRIDPSYYDAHLYLANSYLMDVDKTSKDWSATGNTPADSKRRSELVQKRVKESETALQYLEKLEKMKAPDKDAEIEVLQKLSQLYYYTADDKKAAYVEKRLKALGVED
jgi:predicted Zn-dependent protease